MKEVKLLFRDILKNEVEIENDFDISLLYNHRRDSDEEYKRLLKKLFENDALKVKKYMICNHEEFYEFSESIKFSNKEHCHVFHKLQKYQREPRIDIEYLMYVYFNFKNENFELSKQLASPLFIQHSNYIDICLFNNYYMITNTNETAGDFVKLCLFKGWRLFIVSKDIGDLFLYEIIRGDNFLGIVENVITKYNLELEEGLKKAAKLINEIFK